jgi:hypothetical protein
MPFFMGRRTPHPHQACRSLLQKAVRRGHVELTRRTACHLRQVGDGAWLRQRTAVIVFEECWPFAADLDWAPGAVVECLARVAQTVKVKDATGLGSLAHVVANGEESVLTGSCDDRHIRRVADAVREPSAFWAWVRERAGQGRERTLVDAAQQAHRRGGWPWDQAFMLAAAYLAVTVGLPDVQVAEPETGEFPFWAALDRHTPQGKVALRAVAKRERVPLRELLWVSFYFEGAVTNRATDSAWWCREVAWRLSRVGLNWDQGRQRWDRLRPVVAAALSAEAELLREHIQAPV